jgi:hypothetical protein
VLSAECIAGIRVLSALPLSRDLLRNRPPTQQRHPRRFRRALTRMIQRTLDQTDPRCIRQPCIAFVLDHAVELSADRTPPAIDAEEAKTNDANRGRPTRRRGR